jgi:hypothetical protein
MQNFSRDFKFSSIKCSYNIVAYNVPYERVGYIGGLVTYAKTLLKLLLPTVMAGQVANNKRAGVD